MHLNEISGWTLTTLTAIYMSWYAIHTMHSDTICSTRILSVVLPLFFILAPPMLIDLKEIEKKYKYENSIALFAKAMQIKWKSIFGSCELKISTWPVHLRDGICSIVWRLNNKMLINNYMTFQYWTLRMISPKYLVIFLLLLLLLLAKCEFSRFDNKNEGCDISISELINILTES